MTLEEKIDVLEWLDIHSDAIQCMISIHGYNEETLSDILYWKTGYKDFEQFLKES